MKKEITVHRNDRGFGFIELESGSHGHIRTRVWVRNEFILPERQGYVFEHVVFPLHANLDRTEKGSLVIRPGKGVIYIAEIPSGYRGWATIQSVHGGAIMASGEDYASGQGALGCTAWALVAASGPIEVFGERTGRRIDNGRVAFRLTPDGEEEELVEDTELCDIME